MKADAARSVDAAPTADTAAPRADPLWYKDAVIYELHIKAFFDANGDGIGDFQGLISKLDYVAELGVNTIWLLPFYPSPFRDDGYDVADFRGVNPAYGHAADVAVLVREAHARGLRVITELVVNHTSDQHPWFQAARKAPKGSPERAFYVWSDDPATYAGTRIIFTDTEKSNWTWDEVAGQYFWHRFFSHQPDLNFDNPAVREAVFEVMEFWLEQGVDGFRLDAIPYLIEREGTSNENLRETHEVIKELRRRLDAKYTDKLLLAEANMWPEDVREYFGEEDECHMAYHFPLMPRMYMAIAQEDRHPVVEILQQTPEIAPASQWAIFLRNHDELTLEMVTSKERDYMYSMYAAEPRARINLGIRRRLAPLLENDRERIKLMNSLLLSMPGSPVLYYGDEIGMGDNIFLGDRDGVRTPMQWTSDRNGGFSRADPQRLYLPPIMDPVYGFEAVNVEAQSRDASSLLNWTRRLLATRRSTQVFGRGRITMLHPGNRKVLAYLRELGDEAVLCVANLGRTAQPVELDLVAYKGRVPVEMGGRTPFPPIGDPPYPLTLPGHGFFWFRLATDVAPPDWHTQRLSVEDLPVLVLFDGWSSFFRERVVPWRIAMATKTLSQFESELLPRFVARQRWFGGSAERPGAVPAKVHVAEHVMLAQGSQEWLLTVLETPGAERPHRWFVPFSLGWEDGDEERFHQLTPSAMAKVRMQARVGVMADALADESFCLAVVQSVASGRELRMARGHLRFKPEPAFKTIAGDIGTLGPLRPAPSRRGTAAQLGDRVFIKLMRSVHEGVDAELETGRHLHQVAAFRHGAAPAGSVEWVGADGTVHTLVLLQAWLQNQGNGRTLAVQQLARELARQTVEAVPGAFEAGFVAAAQQLALHTVDMHAALATPTSDPAFAAEPVTASDLSAWSNRTLALTRDAFARLRDAATAFAAPSQALARRVAAALPVVERIAARVAALPASGHKIRIHGAYRLQNVLVVHDDLAIVGFEGGAGFGVRPGAGAGAGAGTAAMAADPRSKQSPLRDIASMLQSIDQAAFEALHNDAHTEPEFLRMQAQVRQWSSGVRDAFLQAYAAAPAAASALGATAQPDTMQALLELFELDLALLTLVDALHRPHPSTGIVDGLPELAARLDVR